MTNPTIADTLAYFRGEKQKQSKQHQTYYDTAILALDTFESRRCRNCTWNYDNGCTFWGDSVPDRAIAVEPDDYCGHFEEKE